MRWSTRAPGRRTGNLKAMKPIETVDRKKLREIRRQLRTARRGKEWPIDVQRLDKAIERTKTNEGNRDPVLKMPEYMAWWSLCNQIDNPLAGGYEKFGGAGVTIAKRWRNFASFRRDMGVKPSSDHFLELFPDPLGVFGPGNTRWLTFEQKMRNRKIKAAALAVRRKLQNQQV